MTSYMEEVARFRATEDQAQTGTVEEEATLAGAATVRRKPSPPKPPKTCYACGGHTFWERSQTAGSGLVCQRCHPDPRQAWREWQEARRGEGP